MRYCESDTLKSLIDWILWFVQDEVVVLRNGSSEQSVVEEKLIDCIKSREDYFECLHGRKENDRMHAVMNEKRRQEEEAKRGGSGEH